MSYRRRQAALARAMCARPRDSNPQGWGRNIEVGASVTTFGRAGVGQPAIDGTVVAVDGQTVTIRDRYADREVRRTISNIRRTA